MLKAIAQIVIYLYISFGLIGCVTFVVAFLKSTQKQRNELQMILYKKTMANFKGSSREDILINVSVFLLTILLTGIGITWIALEYAGTTEASICAFIVIGSVYSTRVRVMTSISVMLRA